MGIINHHYRLLPCYQKEVTEGRFEKVRKASLEDKAKRRAESTLAAQSTKDATEEALQALSKEASLNPQHLKTFVALMLQNTLKNDYDISPKKKTDINLSDP